MENIEQYETLSEAVAALKAQGYSEDFNLKEDCIECGKGAYRYYHNEFHVDKLFRFYGANDPADESVVYAISSADGHIKGVLVNGFGPTSDPLTVEMLEKLTIG